MKRLPIAASPCLLMMLMIANYAAWLIGVPDVMRTIMLALMACCIAAMIAERLTARDFLFLPMLLVLALVILFRPLSSSSLSWDAYFIWFFHAKRTFYDGSIYARLDGYGWFSHNDYPDLVPSLAASLTRAAGLWNELLPKLAILPAILPALALLFKFFNNFLFRFVLLNFTIICLEPYLLSGYMDGILALYVAVLLIHTAVIFGSSSFAVRRLSWPDVCTAALLLAMISGLKNEGITLALLYAFLFMGMLLYARHAPHIVFRTLAIFALAFLPVIVWKMHLQGSAVSNDLLSAGSLKERALARLNLHSVMLILGYTIKRQIFAVSLSAYIGTFFIAGKKLSQFFALSWLFSYYLLLFSVYLITPNELKWHLETSAERVMMPINLSLFVFTLWSLQEHLATTQRLSCRQNPVLPDTVVS